VKKLKTIFIYRKSLGMLEIAIVEDEIEMGNLLEGYLNQLFASEKRDCHISYFDNGIKFLNKFRSQYDLIFLDIKMPSIDGMELAKKIRAMDTKVMIIFVTSLAQYAIKGYEVNAFDYILKPIDFYNFKLKMTRALPFLNKNNDYSFTIDYKNVIKRIDVDELMYIEIYNHHLYFHLSSGEKIPSYGTMKTYTERLKNSSFVLCNQCYFVNLKYVKEVTNDFVTVGEDKLALSRPRRQDFIRHLNNYLVTGNK